MKKLPSDFPDIALFEGVFADLGITARQVEGAMGYAPGQIPDAFATMVAEILAETPALCRIRGGYRVISDIGVDPRGGRVILEGQAFTSGKIITAAMRDSESIAALACTAGQGITDRTRALFEAGDPVSGHILDTIGSLAAECIADQVQAILEQEMSARGRSITNRYSPGYCFWPVAEQHLFFSLLPEDFCGISLTESALMVPIKSISAIIGIGEKVVKRDYECGACDQMDCIRRQQI